MRDMKKNNTLEQLMFVSDFSHQLTTKRDEKCTGNPKIATTRNNYQMNKIL